MSFHLANFNKRFASMGDEAEAVFEDVYPNNWVRFGLNRPPLKMSMLPARIRNAPDYLTSASFVEVQGFGSDQVLKLKYDKLNSLHWWDGAHPVDFFFWDSKNERHTQVSLKTVRSWIDDPAVVLDRFHDSGAYFAIPASIVFGES